MIVDFPVPGCPDKTPNPLEFTTYLSLATASLCWEDKYKESTAIPCLKELLAIMIKHHLPAHN